MWILFSPSEKKRTSHSQEIQSKKGFYKDFLTPNLKEVLDSYHAFLTSASDEELKRLLGVKKLNIDEIALLQNIFKTPLLKAILRYDGVAFRALDYENLPLNSQEYIDRQVLIFSNLFVVVACLFVCFSLFCIFKRVFKLFFWSFRVLMCEF